MNTTDIDEVFLRGLLSYDRVTGVFRWKKRPSNNTQVGGVAGTSLDTGYRAININDKPHLSHRLAWIIVKGQPLPSQIDHINGDPSDNRWSNLRAACPLTNCRNRALSKRSASGVVGVYLDRKKWRARITVNYVVIYLGSYDDKPAAICARKAAEKKYGFHPNHGRTT